MESEFFILQCDGFYVVANGMKCDKLEIDSGK